MTEQLLTTLRDSRLTAADMMRVFCLKKTAFYQLLAIGRFNPFEIRPRIGKRAWSAKKVQAYLDGDGVGQHPRAVTSRLKQSA